MAPHTIILPPPNFIDLVIYFSWNLVPFGRLTYSLLPNTSSLHSSINMTSFHNEGSTLEKALHQLRRLRTYRSFKNDFLAAIRPSSPYFLKMFLTVDIEVGLLDLQSIWSSRAVFFGWHMASRINNLSHMSSFLRGLPDLWRSSRVLCCWRPCLEMFRSMAIFLWHQPSWNF